MFRADALLANVLKHRKEANKTSTQSQLARFKFRVLSLLEHFLQKHPRSSLVFIAVQGLLKAFVDSVHQLGTAPEESELFVKRLESILQLKVVKARHYPTGQDVDLAAARVLLSRTFKLASKSSILRVRTLGQVSFISVILMVYRVFSLSVFLRLSIWDNLGSCSHSDHIFYIIILHIRGILMF